MSEISVTTEDNLLLFTAHGVLTADEVIATAAHYYIRNPRFIIWDLTNASMANMSTHDVKRIAANLKKYSEHRENGKTAFVGHRDVDFGLFRMYASFAEIEGVQTTFSVFRTLERARAWLLETEPGKMHTPF